MDGIEWKVLRPEKDDTDTESAVQTAAELGAEEIHIVGGTGSRLDHMLANVYLLGLLREEGISAYLVDAHNRVQVIDQRTVIKRETQYGKYVSLLPFMGAVEGITLKGMKYPLEDYTLDHCHSIGISNEITGEQAEIELRTGRLVVIEKEGRGKVTERGGRVCEFANGSNLYRGGFFLYTDGNYDGDQYSERFWK